MATLMKRSLLLVALLLGGCPPKKPQGATCEYNTDCADPLVCALQSCRKECMDSRDCAAGLLCLHFATGGVCQQANEAVCANTSDCTTALVCSFGTCTTVCSNDRDCGLGATCQVDTGPDASTACIETTTELCIYNSDCPPDPQGRPQVCDDQQNCRVECVDYANDCDPLRHCESYRCYPGAPDAGL
jgi:hypothetical protein